MNVLSKVGLMAGRRNDLHSGVASGWIRGFRSPGRALAGFDFLGGIARNAKCVRSGDLIKARFVTLWLPTGVEQGSGAEERDSGVADVMR